MSTQLRSACYYFLVLAVNSNWFQILLSYKLLLKPPVLPLVRGNGSILCTHVGSASGCELLKQYYHCLCKCEDFTHSSQTVFPVGIWCRSYWPNSGCHNPPSLLHPPPPPLPRPPPTYPNHLAPYTWIRPSSLYPTHPCPSWMQLHVNHPSPLIPMDRSALTYTIFIAIYLEIFKGSIAISKKSYSGEKPLFDKYLQKICLSRLGTLRIICVKYFVGLNFHDFLQSANF